MSTESLAQPIAFRVQAHSTHEVKNQPPPLANYNMFTTDTPLTDALRREGGAFAEADLCVFGELLGREDTLQLGFTANKHTPILHTHDRYGRRRDEVEYHPAYHELMRISMAHGLHNSPWRNPIAGAHVARAAHSYMTTQVESGHGCPITMTFGVVPALRHQPDIFSEWQEHLFKLQYDPRHLPASQKTSVIFGMAMTEKQGGSDVRANTTQAVPFEPSHRAYLLTGHKWFCSAPMSDAFLVLAQAPSGLSCFLVPRFLPDGSKNHFFIQRLKDKLGNRSNASSEIEFDQTWAQLIGDEGRGVPIIIEMANHTRLDCVIGSTGLLRQAVVQALHHAKHRWAFGRLLADQPLMRNVLADLCLESEAMTAMMMRLSRAYDEENVASHETGGAGHLVEARSLRRIMTAVAKYWATKRTVICIGEAMECLGGVGYVEESVLPRLYREAPVNSIWEGSGNVICLDVLRAMAKEKGAMEGLLSELRLGAGGDARLDAHIRGIEEDLRKPAELEVGARRLVEKLAVGLQASLLVRHAPLAVADAFCGSRLGESAGHSMGTLGAGTDFGGVLARGWGE